MIALDQGGAALAWARQVPVPTSLSPWSSGAWADTGVGADWRIVADDAPHLIWSETDSPAGVRSRLSLVGPRSVWLQIDRRPRRRTVAVRLRPGSLLPLFDISAAALRDRSVSLDEVVGSGMANQWQERLQGSAGDGVSELLNLLTEHWTHSRASLGRRAPERRDWRVSAVLDPDAADANRSGIGDRGLQALSRRTGVSTRTMRRVFAEQVGLSPVHTVRIRRLHRALLAGSRRAALGAGEYGWAGVAAAHGYTDQSHLIRDCRALLGETPGAFMARGVGRVSRPGDRRHSKGDS